MKKLLLSITMLLSAIVGQAQISLVADINPTGDAATRNIVEMNGKLYFTADDGVNGRELWCYNPGTNTSQMVHNINPGNAHGMEAYFTFDGNSCFQVLNGKLYFSANDGVNGVELWVYDGVNTPTMVADLYPGASDSDPTEYVAFNNKLYFSAKSQVNGFELWVYNPATNLAEVITDIAPGALNAAVSDKVVFNDKIYFHAQNQTEGSELYVYDPSNNNTSLVADLEPGVDGSYPGQLIVANNKLYYKGFTVANGWEVYCYTGTGTPTRLTDIASGAANSVYEIGVAFNNKLLINATDGTNGKEFYTMDLTTNTTQLLLDIDPGSGDGYPYEFTAYANKVYFIAKTAATGYELWMYDGTNTPAMITDLKSGSVDGILGFLTVVNDTMYMCAQNATSGYELFRMYDVAVSVGEYYKEVSVVSYPVPASEAAHIRITTPSTVSCSVAVYDITGKVVFEKAVANYAQGTSEIEVPMSGIATGNYIYKLTDKAGEVFATGKIVKQ